MPPYALAPAQPPAGISCPPASPHRLTTTCRGPSHTTLARRSAWCRWLAQQGSSGTLLRGYGNINPLSIDYASRPRLRSRLTQGGLAWPWNPWSSGGRVSHPPAHRGLLPGPGAGRPVRPGGRAAERARDRGWLVRAAGERGIVDRAVRARRTAHASSSVLG